MTDRANLLPAAFFLLTACSAAPALPPPPPAAPIAACLTLVVQEGKPVGNLYDRDVQKAVRTSFEEAMIGAGFNVLTDPALPHDLVARVDVEPGSRVETGARVRAVLTLEARGKAVDRIEVSSPQEAPGYGGAVADQLVDGVFRSGELAVFTK